MDRRVQRPAPGAADYADVALRVDPGQHCPEHVVDAVDVDVGVDHHHHAAGVGRRPDLPGHVQRLGGVAGVGLLDRHDGHHPVAGLRRQPHAADPGHAGALELLGDQRGLEVGEEAVVLVRRLALRAAEQDRLVAVVDGGHADHRGAAGAAGVVAHPLAVGSLVVQLAGVDPALDGDLGGGGDRQPGVAAAHHLDRLAADAARPVQLALPVGDALGAGGHEQQRVGADHDHHRAAPAAVEVALAHQQPVLAGADVHAHGVALEDLVAVGADVDPVGVGVAQDVEAGGADEAAAVPRVPDGHREGVQVDRVAFQHVLQHGAVGGLDRRDRAKFVEDAAPEGDQALVGGHLLGEAQRHRLALRRAAGVDQHAVAGRVARDLVEQHRRRALGVVQQLGDLADTALPVHAASATDAARPRPRKPL